jgi:hypothetical protein
LDAAASECADPLRYCAWDTWVDAAFDDSTNELKALSAYDTLLTAQARCVELGPMCAGIEQPPDSDPASYTVWMHTKKRRRRANGGDYLVHRPMGRAWVPAGDGCPVWAERRQEQTALADRMRAEDLSRQSAVDLSLQTEHLSALQNLNRSMVAGLDGVQSWFQGQQSKTKR